MAELPAGSRDTQGDEPMTTTTEATQPQEIDATAASREEINTSSHVACEAGSAVTKISPASPNQNEANESVREHSPDCEDSGINDSVAGVGEAQVVAEDPDAQVEKVKKKKKRTPKSRRGISGFEEYYADAPMTPAEALEKKKLYDPTRPFADRIEECIQRYRARRRLDPLRTNMFNKYLFLGGIDASQRQFTGLSQDRGAMAEADAEEIRKMTAIDFVGGSGSRFYDNNSEDWEVDFEAIVKGFLSRTITDWYLYDAEANQLAADLIKNFLNYVLMHDACPEYTGNILAARNVCDTAPTELRYMHELVLELPGIFNSAAQSLFCDGNINRLDQDEKNYEALVTFRLTALVWYSGRKAKEYKQRIIETEDPTTIKLVSTREETYQILGIERPYRKDKKTVNEQLAAMELDGKVKPAGFIRVAPSIIAHGWGNMPRPEEDGSQRHAEEEDFILEDELLAKCKVGMKIRMTVCELNVGLCFIKEVHDVRVSFDTFLPQYLMTNWKEPVPNERPPPSIHNPNAEEQAMDAEEKVDV